MSNAEGNLKEIFRSEAKKVKVFLRSGKTKGANFDPFRNTGYTTTLQNPTYIKAIIRDVSPEKLIVKDMGLTFAGSKELIVKDTDVNTLKICEKITIDEIDYYPYSDAIGNKFLVFKRPFGFSRVIIFRKET